MLRRVTEMIIFLRILSMIFWAQEGDSRPVTILNWILKSLSFAYLWIVFEVYFPNRVTFFLCSFSYWIIRDSSWKLTVASGSLDPGFLFSDACSWGLCSASNLTRSSTSSISIFIAFDLYNVGTSRIGSQKGIEILTYANFYFADFSIIDDKWDIVHDQ